MEKLSALTSFENKQIETDSLYHTREEDSSAEIMLGINGKLVIEKDPGGIIKSLVGNLVGGVGMEALRKTIKDLGGDIKDTTESAFVNLGAKENKVAEYIDHGINKGVECIFKAIGSGAKKPSEVFESLMKNKLKHIQNHKDKNDLTIQTEWYDLEHKNKIFKAFEEVKKSNEEAKTGVNTSTRSHKKMKIDDDIQVEWKLKNSRKTEWYDAVVLKITKDTYTVKYDEDDSVMTHPLKTPWRFQD